jgi:hypothetical protein
VPGRYPSRSPPFAGLDGRAAEDDAVDLLRLQRLHRLGHGEVGLAGAGRADAEGDGVLVDRVDVPLLVEGLRADRAAPVAQDVEGQHLGRTLGGLEAEHADDALDGLGGDTLAGADDRDQLVDEPLGERDLARLTVQRDAVSTHVDIGSEGLLDQREVLVSRSQDTDHVDAVGHHDDVTSACAP